MRLPSLNGLRAFEAAARHLSMRLAADELYVTASAVSQLVRSLERELGIALFVRRHRALLLTREGQELLPAVRTAFRLISEASARICRSRENGSLTVSVTSFFAETWLVPRLGDFHARHPEVELRITSGAALASLTTGEADIAIRHGLGDYPGMVSDLLMAPPVVPVASPELVKRLGLPKTAIELLEWPLVHDTDRGAWALWASYLALRATVPSKGVAYDDPALLRSAVMAGQGVGLLPEPLIAPLIAARSLIAVGPAATLPAVAYYLIVPRAALMCPAVMTFRQWVREQFGPSE